MCSYRFQRLRSSGSGEGGLIEVEGDRNRLLFLAVMCWTRGLGGRRDTAMIAVLVKWSQARC
jgi:hypothetical protein